MQLIFNMKKKNSQIFEALAANAKTLTQKQNHIEKQVQVQSGDRNPKTPPKRLKPLK